MLRIKRFITRTIDLYRIAFFLGMTGYGGYAVLDQIKKEYVVKRDIVTEEKFLTSLSLAQVLPGSTIISLIAYFSYLKAGLIGSILSTIIYLLPTFILTTVLSAIYFQSYAITILPALMSGLNILLILLLIKAMWGIGKSVYRENKRVDLAAVLISVICFTFYSITQNTILVIMLSGFLGVMFYRKTYEQSTFDLHHHAHKQFFVHKKSWLLLMTGILFFSVFLYLVSTTYWLLFGSFAKVGLLSFGGGFAAIPLIEEIVVHQQGWVTDIQFWDGIALSQITPGPILISTAFFGYKVAGIMGAVIATIGMCIPSIFLMIIIGKIHDRIGTSKIIQSLIKGFLAGFIGVVSVLIVQQGIVHLKSWQAIVIFIMLFLILRLRRGTLYAVGASLAYSTVLFFFL
ncbi:MAG: chromate efflux transporter [Microgenomates group bacterium]